MPTKGIFVPGLFARPSELHATIGGDLVLTTAVAAVDGEGRPLSSDPAVQVDSAYDALARILGAAGVGWANVIRLAHYVDPVSPPALHEAIARRMSLSAPASGGMTVPLGSGRDGVMVRVEATAVVGRTVSAIGDAAAEVRGSRAGGYVFMQARRDGNADGGSLAKQTGSIYGAFDALLKQDGSVWDDLTRVRQYIADPRADFDRVREGRQDYVPAGRFLSTSVALPAERGESNKAALIVELNAEPGGKQVFPDVPAQGATGTAQAMRRGGLVHLQAPIADVGGVIQHPGDVEAQARIVYAKLGSVLVAAGADWSKVAVSRVYCRYAKDIERVRVLERELTAVDTVKPDHVARFFDDAALVEVEIVAHA